MSGCQDPAGHADTPAVQRPAGIITLGDIASDEPATRVLRIQPLADYLGEHLAEHGIGRGRVIVARNIGEMAQLIKDGKVDFFLDSPYPVLAVNREAGSQSILLRFAKDDAEYWSVIVTRKDSGLRTLEDLNGTVAVFQEPHSTSGFLLPAALLLDEGLSMQAVARLDGDVIADRVGCHFSGDEENTIELVFSGDASAGVISNQDFRELPQETRDELFVIARTQSVPRQLVTQRPGLDPALAQTVRELLLGLTDQDREHMAAQDTPRGWTWRFAALSETALAALTGLEAKMDLLPACVVAR